ncbi:putative ribonuclease H-like domain-containing protein [Tanacetum coccineum]
MDVKSAFLYGKIEKEVYVCQPPRFEVLDFLDRVYKVEKALYGLHQAPRAWYETLSTYLLDNRFQRRKIDKTLFIRRDKGDILLVQVYVDDIIFGFTKKSLCTEYEKMMHKKFQMSSMGELTFFLGLQVKQKEDGIFLSQDKYVTEILKEFGFSDVKTASTPMETHKPLLKDTDVCACARFQVNPKISHICVVKRIFRYLKSQHKLGLWYLKDSPFDLVAYTDSDYVGASLDRKSTTRGCQFLRCRLISWQCKTQTVVANSTTEAEYIAASNCCGHKKQKPRKPKRKDTEISQSSGPTEPIADEAANEENVPTHSNDPLLNVLDLENTKTAQAQEISSLKLRVKRLEKKGGSRTHKLKRLFKVGRSAQVVSSEDEGLCDQEDASKQGRNIIDIDQDAKDVVKKEVSIANPVTTSGEVVTTASVEVSVATTTTTTAITEVDLTLAQTLAELRSAKPKVMVQEPVHSTTTTAPSTIPKAKSITFRDPGESTTRTTLTPIPSNIKNKGKAKMIEPMKPSKKKE